MSAANESWSFLKEAVERWPTRLGLVAALLLVFVLSAAASAIVPTPIAASVGLLAALSTLGAWVWAWRLPRIRHGKVGLAISVTTSDSADEVQFADDFISELTRLIGQSSAANSFQVLRIPAHHSTKVAIGDSESASGLLTRTRSTFLLHVSVRKRKHQGKGVLVLDIMGAVAHQPISTAVSQQLGREFGELMPSRLTLESDSDLLSFTFTGELMSVVARYIIGIAAAVSGDFDYAEQLYRSVSVALNSSSTKSPAFSKLRDRVPIRVAEIQEARAGDAFRGWLDTADSRSIERMKYALATFPREARQSPRFMTLQAILTFIVARDAKSALGLLNRMGRQRDSTWYFNVAFLHAYDGDTRKALQLYRRGTLMDLPPDVPAQLEMFMSRIVEEEPAKVQLRFCLGYLNKEVKGDAIRARQELEHFVREASPIAYAEEIALAKDWMAELECMPSD